MIVDDPLLWQGATLSCLPADLRRNRLSLRHHPASIAHLDPVAIRVLNIDLAHTVEAGLHSARIAGKVGPRTSVPVEPGRNGRQVVDMDRKMLIPVGRFRRGPPIQYMQGNAVPRSSQRRFLSGVGMSRSPKASW
jgi:hypothetical protein